MRGEHQKGFVPCGIQIGSPPHARGTLDIIKRLLPSARITPACAGNTQVLREVLHYVWDHPRMRGEH